MTSTCPFVPLTDGFTKLISPQVISLRKRGQMRIEFRQGTMSQPTSKDESNLCHPPSKTCLFSLVTWSFGIECCIVHMRMHHELFAELSRNQFLNCECGNELHQSSKNILLIPPPSETNPRKTTGNPKVAWKSHEIIIQA